LVLAHAVCPVRSDSTGTTGMVYDIEGKDMKVVPVCVGRGRPGRGPVEVHLVSVRVCGHPLVLANPVVHIRSDSTDTTGMVWHIGGSDMEVVAGCRWR
jgi:hypothetical protein